jgi:chromosome segregation ATPase
MVTLEQVKLLETKVIQTVEYVERISRENSQLQGKLDSYRKRIDELEVLIQKFREDQGRIEEGILAALERLNKFEDAIEKSIAEPIHSPPVSKTSPQREAKKEKPETHPEPDVSVNEPKDSPPPVEFDLKAEDSSGQDRENREGSPSGGEEDLSEDNPDAGELDIF